MIEYVCLVCQVWLVLEGILHRGDALLVLAKGVVGDALLVEDLRVAVVDLQGCGEVIYAVLVAFHIVVALGSILEVVDVLWLSLDSLVKAGDSLLEVASRVIAASKTIVDCCTRFFFVVSLVLVFLLQDGLASFELFDGLSHLSGFYLGGRKVKYRH